MQQTHILTLSLENIFHSEENKKRLESNSYYNHGLAMAIDISGLLSPFITSPPSPYLLTDYRIGLITKGHMKGIVNLRECEFRAGTAVIVTPGTIAEPIWASDDFTITGIGMPDELLALAHRGKLPPVFSGLAHNVSHVLSEQEFRLANGIFHSLWQTLNMPVTSNSVLLNLIAALSCFYNDLFTQPSPEDNLQLDNAHQVFNRFLALVNQHCREQRLLGFYADRLCVTTRYLGTLVKQASGVTAKEWIDKAVVTAAKVMLRHSNLSIIQIADNLNFANPSFFCKYFKRIAGCTPQHFRNANK